MLVLYNRCVEIRWELPFCGGSMLEFFKKIFSVNLNEYSYININLEINKVVLAATAAFIIGIVIMSNYRRNVRTVALQLTRHGAESEETSKTLAELGLGSNKAIIKLLSPGAMLTKFVARVGEVTNNYEDYVTMSKEEKKNLEKIDYNEARFYIREEHRAKIEDFVGKYDVSIQSIVVSCVLVGVIGISVILAMPEILNTINSIIKSVKM